MFVLVIFSEVELYNDLYKLLRILFLLLLSGNKCSLGKSPSLFVFGFFVSVAEFDVEFVFFGSFSCFLSFFTIFFHFDNKNLDSSFMLLFSDF